MKSCGHKTHPYLILRWRNIHRCKLLWKLSRVPIFPHVFHTLDFLFYFINISWFFYSFFFFLYILFEKFFLALAIRGHAISNIGCSTRISFPTPRIPHVIKNIYAHVAKNIRDESVSRLFSTHYTTLQLLVPAKAQGIECEANSLSFLGHGISHGESFTPDKNTYIHIYIFKLYSSCQK